MALERRRPGHVRFPVCVPALMVPAARPWGPSTSGETRNISRGGVRLRVAAATFPSHQVQVILPLVDQLSPTLTGTVVWSVGQSDAPGWDLGIQFAEEIPGRLVAEIADKGFRGPAGLSE